MAEILIIFIAMLLGGRYPASYSFVMGKPLNRCLPGFSSGHGKKEPGLMDMPPRDPNESILNRDMLINITVQSLAMTAVVLASFYYGWQTYGIDMGVPLPLLH